MTGDKFYIAFSKKNISCAVYQRQYVKELKLSDKATWPCDESISVEDILNDVCSERSPSEQVKAAPLSLNEIVKISVDSFRFLRDSVTNTYRNAYRNAYLYGFGDAYRRSDQRFGK